MVNRSGTLCRTRRAIAALLVLAMGAALAAGQASVSEARLKAAIVYKLTRFVTWPPGAFAAADAPLRVCALGDGAFIGELSAIDGRNVGRRVLRFEQLRPGDTGGGSCQILVVAGDAVRPLPAAEPGSPTLTIGDGAGFAERGGMIALARVGSRVRFRINLVAARAAGLRLNASLLELADIVE